MKGSVGGPMVFAVKDPGRWERRQETIYDLDRQNPEWARRRPSTAAKQRVLANPPPAAQLEALQQLALAPAGRFHLGAFLAHLQDLLVGRATSFDIQHVVGSAAAVGAVEFEDDGTTIAVHPSVLRRTSLELTDGITGRAWQLQPSR